MTVVVTSVGKIFGAVRTFEWSFSSMNPFMCLKQKRGGYKANYKKHSMVQNLKGYKKIKEILHNENCIHCL